MRKKPRGTCLLCGKVLNRPKKRYCNNRCHLEFRRRDYIKRWLAGQESGLVRGRGRSREFGISKIIRTWMVKTRGERCERCGWKERHPTTGRVPLQLDHLDGDHHNARPENLRHFCPNCHSLTPTFGALNKGWRGRSSPADYTPFRSTSRLPVKKMRCRNCGGKFETKRQGRKFCSRACYGMAARRVPRPTKRRLQEDIARSSWSAIGRKYGVSVAAVKNWARRYGIVR